MAHDTKEYDEGGDRETQSWVVATETSGGHDKVKSLEVALGTLGPEDNCAKEQIQEVLRRAKEGRQAVRVNPEIVKAEAVAKVERLQKALDALGGLGGGPEVDVIKRALRKAQEVAREPSQNSSRSAIDKKLNLKFRSQRSKFLIFGAI